MDPEFRIVDSESGGHDPGSRIQNHGLWIADPGSGSGCWIPNADSGFWIHILDPDPDCIIQNEDPPFCHSILIWRPAMASPCSTFIALCGNSSRQYRPILHPSISNTATMTSLPKEETLVLQNDHFRSLVADRQHFLFYAPTSDFVQQNLILLNKICFCSTKTLSKQKQGATIVAKIFVILGFCWTNNKFCWFVQQKSRRTKIMSNKIAFCWTKFVEQITKFAFCSTKIRRLFNKIAFVQHILLNNIC